MPMHTIAPLAKQHTCTFPNHKILFDKIKKNTIANRKAAYERCITLPKSA